MPDADYVIRPATGAGPAWINAAGLVLEQIGRPRWRMGDGTDGGCLIARGAAEAMATLADETPGIYEVEGEDAPLPLRLASTGLAKVMDAASGLYTHLDNYNGIRGVRPPYEVPVPTRHPRHQPRRPVPVPPDRATAPAPIRHAAALASDGEMLLQSVDGEVLACRRGASVLLGLPMFSLLAEHLTAPVFIGEDYGFSEPVHHLLLLLDHLLESIATPGTMSVAPWPRDARGVVALRHDYDRPMDLVELAASHRDLGVRPTMHLLPDLLPDPDQSAALRAIGAEIGLHSRRLDAMADEAKTVADATGAPVVGHSAHGGKDADGWQGLPNLLAAHDAGLAYTELLNEMQLHPHRVPDFAAGPGAALGPIALPHHLSFDVNMREDDEDRLTREVGAVFASRGCLVLMNHPDINLDGLLTFMRDYLPPDTPWMTLAEIAAWWRATHVQGALDAVEVDASDDQLVVRGSIGPEQVGVVLRVAAPRGTTVVNTHGVERASIDAGGVTLTLGDAAVDGFEVAVRSSA